MLRGVGFEAVYWPGAPTDGGSWKQVGYFCGIIVTSNGIWFYYIVNVSFCSGISIYTISNEH